jgi:hypothetical protein
MSHSFETSIGSVSLFLFGCVEIFQHYPANLRNHLFTNENQELFEEELSVGNGSMRPVNLHPFEVPIGEFFNPHVP